MRKAQRQTQKAVVAIKEATGLNQKQLADMTGASLATVKSWTKKNPSVMSDYFRQMIYYQLGAAIQPDGSVKEWNGKHPFTGAHYRFWRGGFRSDDKARAVKLSEDCAAHLRVLFLSALPADKSGTNKLIGVWASFGKWLEKTAVEFGLGNRCRTLLQKEKLPAFLSY